MKSLEIGHNTITAPKGCKKDAHQLFQDIIFIVFNTISLEEINKFLMKRYLTVVDLLILNIVDYRTL